MRDLRGRPVGVVLEGHFDQLQELQAVETPRGASSAVCLGSASHNMQSN